MRGLIKKYVLCALQLAGLRGADVRLIIPEKPDLLITSLSALSCLQKETKTGHKVYRYKKGFLHQKTMLIDDDRTMIGTANLEITPSITKRNFLVIHAGLEKCEKKLKEIADKLEKVI